MTKFFVIAEDPALSHKVAYAETPKPRFEKNGPVCPQCGQMIACPRMIPPHDVWLKAPRLIPDVVNIGSSHLELLVSANLAIALTGLKGVERIDKARISKVGTKKSKAQPPDLFAVQITHSQVRVDFNACEPTWTDKPADDYCRRCGPGGGGPGGCLWSFEKIVLDLEHWTGEEIFYPINLATAIIVTGEAAEKTNLSSFQNLLLVPIENYRHSYGPIH